jgi:anti-sigma-K factor RskA
VLPSTPALDAPGRAVLTPARAPAIFPVPVAMVARRPSWVVRIAALAAVIAIVVLGGLGLSLQRQLDAERAYRDGVSAALALAARPGSQTALLAAGDGSVSGLGVVGADGTVRLAMRGLTATSGTQVYTAWAIGGSGTPVAIGDFTVGADGTAVAAAHVPAAEAGVVLALTLEPRGGDTTPRAPVVAKGVARPPAG